MSQPKQQILPPVKPRRGAKMRSPRYYISLMDDIFNQACRGLRSTADAQRLHTMAKEGLEAHLSLLMIQMSGQDQAIDVAPGPEENYQAPQVCAHRQKRVVAKRGTGRHGEPVDEVTVSITSNAEDPDSEVDAEIESLT